MSESLSVPHESARAAVLRRRWVLVAALTAMFMAAVEATIVATAMPTIVADLGGFHLFSWVFSIYLLTQAVTIPIYGRLADLYGRKRIFVAGAVVFLIGSTLCGFARGMVTLICFRALQGVGAGAIVPIATTIVGDIYGPKERARVQGYVASVWGVSAIVGPVLGAFLVAHLSWATVFWVNLPIGVLSIGLLTAALKEQLHARQHRIDYAGSALLMLGTGALMLALVQWTSFTAPLLAGLLVAAAVLLSLLLLNETRCPEPMLPLDLWRNRVVTATNVGALAIGAVMMGVTGFLPIYVQGVMGRSAVVAGFALTSMSIGWPVGSAIAGRLLLHSSYRAMSVIGSLCLVVGGVMLAMLDPGRGPLWAGAGAFLIGIGMGFCNTTYIVAAQSSVAWAQRGIATSSNVFMRMAGQSIGAAICGGILNSTLAHRLAGVGDAVDRLMEPAQRQALPPGEVLRLTDAIGGALHNVYLVTGALSVIALVLAFRLPSGLGPMSGEGH